MADAGTLATTAQVLLAIGADASAAQILEANTNIWIFIYISPLSYFTQLTITNNNKQ